MRTRRPGTVAEAVAVTVVTVASVVVTLVPGRIGAQEVDPSGPAPRLAVTDTIVLSLEEAEAVALGGSPTLAAVRRDRDIAEGELRQARTYPFNPSAELEVRSLDPDSGVGVFDRYEAVLAQEVEWAGQWGLRRDAAGSGVRVASASVDDAERQVLREVREAFYSAVATERLLEVAADIAALTERLRTTARAELEAGEVSLLDANLAEIEHGRGRARILRAERDRESAFLELKRILGLEPATPIRIEGAALTAAPGSGAGVDTAGGGLPDPGRLDADSLVAFAVERRPDLRRAQAVIDRAGELERLARREAIPNLVFSAPIERESVDGSVEIGLGVGLSVPLWNRSQGTADVRRAELVQAQHARDAVALEVRTEVLDALQRYRSASEAASALEGSILGPAETNLDLLQESYRAGKIDLTTLLVLQNQLLDAQTEYWRAWLSRRYAWARLRAAIGDRS